MSEKFLKTKLSRHLWNSTVFFILLMSANLASAEVSGPDYEAAQKRAKDVIKEQDKKDRAAAAAAAAAANAPVFAEAIKQCVKQMRETVAICNTKAAESEGYCNPDSSPNIAAAVQYGGQGAMIANAFDMGTSGGCGEIAKYSAGLSAGLVVFKKICQQEAASCLKPCEDVIALDNSTDSCRSPPGGPQTAAEIPNDLVRDELDEVRKMVDAANKGQEKCAKQAENGTNVEGQVGQALTTLKQQTTTCKMKTAGVQTADFCAQNPTDQACRGSSGRNCGDAAMANDPVCKCIANPSSCNGVNSLNNSFGTVGSIRGGAGAADLNKGAAGAGAGNLSGLGAMDSAGLGEIGGPVGPKGESRKLGGNKGGSAPSSGGGGGQGGGAPTAAAGGAAVGDNENLYRGGRGGGAAGGSGRGAGSGSAYAGGYRSAPAGALGSGSIYNGRMRGAKGGPNLNDFLPGGRNDPNARGVAGITGPDGITGPHTNLFMKVKNRYQAIRSSLLQN